MDEAPRHHVRLVQGSHIVVRRLYDHERCYIFQNRDGRVIFAIPYENDFTLIGTTDRDYAGDPAAVMIGDGRERLSLRRRQRIFPRARHARSDRVVAIPACGRLFDDGASKAQETTREYVLRLEGNERKRVPC